MTKDNPTSGRNDPYRSFNFEIHINNERVGGFSECSGLTAEGDAVDYREGTDTRPNVRKLIGLRKYANIIFKRGYTINYYLWDWYKIICEGGGENKNIRRSVTIILLNENRKPVLTWIAHDAWINKIEGPSFKASGNEVAMESVELVHEGLTIETS
jgi:phage tail-like protein